MKLYELTKIKLKSNKRIGRGIASGKGKTAGRGTKGQRARGKLPLTFAGDLAFYKKLPNRRGLGNLAFSSNPKTIALSKLNVFPPKAIVDLKSLLDTNIIDDKDTKAGVKILGEGEVKKALTVNLPVSKTAKAKIIKKGGKVTYV